MPIYEYMCRECEKTFEQIRRFSDPPLEACAICGASNPEKLVSASAFHLKGSGWYATDYGTGGNQPKETESTAANTNSEPSSAPSDTPKSKDTPKPTDSSAKTETGS